MNRTTKRNPSLRESWDARSGAPALALRRFVALFAATFLALVGIVGMERVANAAASVTVSNAKLEGSAPVTVGNSLNYSADLKVSGSADDTFTIQLPPELDYEGPLSAPIVGGYGQCVWAGKVSTCTLTRDANNAVGSMSIWVKAVAESSSSSSTITIGGTPTTPQIPGGSIGPGNGSTGSGGVVHKPVPGSPNKFGEGWRKDGPDNSWIAYWKIDTPVYSTRTPVTITDRFQEGNGYLPHSAVTNWQGDFLELLYYTPDPTGTTFPEGDYSNYEPVARFRLDGSVRMQGSAYNSSGPPVLKVDADKKGFELKFDAPPNRMYQLRFYSAPDYTNFKEEEIYNSAFSNEAETSATNVVRGAYYELAEETAFTSIALRKVIKGDGSWNVPTIDTVFTVEYEIKTPDGKTEKVLQSVPHDYMSHSIGLYPSGTTITTKEINLPEIDGINWGKYEITGDGVVDNGDGTFTVAPKDDTTADLVLTNRTAEPSVVIVKKDEAGNDANTVQDSVDLSGSAGATGLVFTITNDGTEDLVDVVVTDQVTAGSGVVENLSCDFSALGGPATGTTWDEGPFKVGDSFTCTADLSGVKAGDQHTDVAKVEGKGIASGKPVSDDDPYNAKVVEPGSGLPITGSDALPLVVASVAATILGVGALVAAKRRRVS